MPVKKIFGIGDQVSLDHQRRPQSLESSAGLSVTRKPQKVSDSCRFYYFILATHIVLQHLHEWNRF